MRRFWSRLAHYHANIFNAAEIGNFLGVSHSAIRNYLDILCGTFMVRQLIPWFANIKKRQVKSPKIYFRDAGILNSLISIDTQAQLFAHPKLDGIWELIKFHNSTAAECYYWRTHTGAELDLLIVTPQRKLGFEIKYTNSPKNIPSMRIAMQDLWLAEMW